MKNVKLHSLVLMALMLLSCSNVMAKDIYLSSTGSDSNDGKTAETAYATLTKALAGATSGDVIKVSGIVKVSEVGKKAHFQTGLTIEGTNPTQDGFDAEGNCGILWLNNSKVFLKNLTFKNAKAGMTVKGDGSGASAVTGSPLILEVDNCIFENNSSTTAEGNVPTGAIALTTPKLGTGEATYLKVTNSQFVGNSSTVSGGAIYCLANVPVTIENCVFKNNSAATNAGAVFVQDPSKLSVANTSFIANTAPNGSGGAVQINYNKSAKENFAFNGCTFYNNSAKSFGGAVQFRGANDTHTVNFVNCTIYGNSTAGGTDNAGGLYLGNLSNITVNIVNTILERNLALGANAYSDVYAGDTKVNLISSIVGNFKDYTNAKYSSGYTADSKCIIGKTVNTTAYGYATVGTLKENYLPLSAGAALTIGNSEKAAEYEVTTDLLGNPIGTKIGAVQVISEGGDGDWNISGLAEDGTTLTVARSLYPNDWNTICLPFEMTKEEQNEQFGEDAEVFYLNQSVNGSVLSFTKNTGSMRAACPYLVKVGAGKTSFKLTKQMTASTPSNRKNDTGIFQGVFFPTELLATDLCVGDNGILFTPAEGQRKINGLRAYFQVVEGKTLSAKLAVLDGGTTGISTVIDAASENANAIYNLSGVYMGQDMKRLEKGIYIVNGKKVVIK